VAIVVCERGTFGEQQRGLGVDLTQKGDAAAALIYNSSVI
jgi:hypothetical protein